MDTNDEFANLQSGDAIMDSEHEEADEQHPRETVSAHEIRRQLRETIKHDEVCSF